MFDQTLNDVKDQPQRTGTGSGPSTASTAMTVESSVRSLPSGPSSSILPRSDGIVVRYVGDSDMFGVGIADETPDRSEAERAIATIAPLFAGA